MFGKLFGGCRHESSSASTSHKLNQTLDMLKEKEIVLQKKISLEAERAKEFMKAKNKQAALQSLKRKKFYEVQMEHLESFQSQIHDQEQKLPQKSQGHCEQMQRMTSNAKSSIKKNNIA